MSKDGLSTELVDEFTGEPYSVSHLCTFPRENSRFWNNPLATATKSTAVTNSGAPGAPGDGTTVYEFEIGDCATLTVDHPFDLHDKVLCWLDKDLDKRLHLSF